MVHCIKKFSRFQKATLIYPHPVSIKEYVVAETAYQISIDIIHAKSSTQNECCLYEMPQYITCDHALGIQWDGFIGPS